MAWYEPQNIASYGVSAGTAGLVSPDAVKTAFGGAQDDPRLVEQQRQLNALLGASAQGQGPSAADASFKSAADTMQAQQYALAFSSPGLAPAQATRMAQMGAAGAGQGLAGQMAAMRLQEQERARMAWMQMLQQQRQGDLQRSQANAAALGGTIGAIGQAGAMGA